VVPRFGEQLVLDLGLSADQLEDAAPEGGGGDPGAGTDRGAVGHDRDALAFADPDDAVGAGWGW
jgi:hypothetical protein